MKDFRKLQVWEKAHQLALALYQVTASFPRDETYGLVSQIRRAAASMTYGFVGGFAAYVQTCTEAYALGLAWVPAYHSRMSVPRGRACLDGESPQKSPQSNRHRLLTTRRASRKPTVG